MTQNYDDIRTRATLLKEKQLLLREKKSDTETAKAEVVQSEEAIKMYDGYLANQQSILAPDEASKVAAHAKVVELQAQQTQLRSRKTTLLTQRDAKDDRIEELVGTGSPPSGGELSDKQDDIDDLDSDNDALEVTLRDTQGDLEALFETKKQIIDDLAAFKASLKALEDSRDRQESPSQDLLDEIQQDKDKVTDKEDELVQINADITDKQADIRSQQTVIDANHKTLETMMKEKRVLQVELDKLHDERLVIVTELRRVGNKLQNLEGEGADEDDVIVDPSDPSPGSALAIAMENATAMDGIVADREALIDSIKNSRTTELTKLTAAKTAQTTAENAERTAQSEVNTVKSQLTTSLDIQKTIEVSAAVRLLRGFLEAGQVVLSSGPTIDAATEAEIMKTFTSSKVRSMLPIIRASFPIPSEYRALREKFVEDVVGSFFNNVTDPNLVDLTTAEVEAFKAAIRQQFEREARALLLQYRLISSPTVSSSYFWFLLVIVAILLLAVGGYFYFYR